MKKVVFTFGRFNPPTTGHELLVKKIIKLAGRDEARVYLSHSQNSKKDPLTYDVKYKFVQRAFGNIVQKDNHRVIFDILKALNTEGFTDVVLVVGSDRVMEFKSKLLFYNGKEYRFDKIDVISAGERDPDAEGVAGMSASKMREFVMKGQEMDFVKGCPTGLAIKDRQDLYKAVRKAMGQRT